MADTAALFTTEPLVLGLNLYVEPSTAALFTTWPLALGLNLYVANYTLAAEACSVPITMQDVSLVTTVVTADIGVSHPLALGLLVGTGGTTNYTMTAEAFSLPITMRNVVFTTVSPAGVQTTTPLIVGILLDAQSFTMAAEAFATPISFAPSETFEIETASAEADGGGWRKFRNTLTSRQQEDEMQKIAAIVCAVVALEGIL